jgi:HK97 family phage major capsid protein
MERVKKLYQEKERLVAEARALLDRAERESRDLTEDEASNYDTLEKRLDAIDAKIQRETKLGDAEQDVNRPVSRAVVPQIGNEVRTTWRDMGIVGARWEQLFPRSNQPPEYRDLPAKTFFLNVAAKTQPEEFRGLLEGVGTQGGYPIPDNLAREIWDSGVEGSQFLKFCRMYRAAEGKDLSVPAWDSADRTAGPIGSVSSTWHGEGQGVPEVDPKFKAITILCHKLGIYTKASREILQDGYGIEEQLGNMLKINTSWNIESAILAANGIAKPLGILNHPAAVVVNRTAASDIQYPDIINMFARLDPMFQAGAVWLCSPPAYAQLLRMVDGASRYIFPPAGYVSAAAAPATTLLGKPIIITDKCSDLGTHGDLLYRAS